MVVLVCVYGAPVCVFDNSTHLTFLHAHKSDDGAGTDGESLVQAGSVPAGKGEAEMTVRVCEWVCMRV